MTRPAIGEEGFAGGIAFLPWLEIAAPVRIGRFQFAMFDSTKPGELLDERIGQRLGKILKSYVDDSAKPISRCTVVTMPRRRRPWDVVDDQWSALVEACHQLAFIHLSERRLFEGHFAPYINATAFQPVLQRITNDEHRMAISVRRRDGFLRLGGAKFGTFLFQRPIELLNAKAPRPNLDLARGLDSARRRRSPLFGQLNEALPLFLFANRDGMLSLDDEVIFSAIAFERLLRPAKPNAFALAKAFAEVFNPYGSVRIRDTERARRIGGYRRRSISVDRDANGADQRAWFIHQKWMKELYECRSLAVHGNPRDHLSSNWARFEHLCAASLLFPLCVKAMLQAEGCYEMTEGERTVCGVVDELLCLKGWAVGRKGIGQWSALLTERIGSAALDRAIDGALRREAKRS